MGITAEEIRQLNNLPGLSEDPSAEGLVRVEEQHILIATTTVHHQQYCTNWDSVTHIHEMINELENHLLISLHVQCISPMEK